jgi:peptidoglycan/LPS O-acetylase OafA/YrhL
MKESPNLDLLRTVAVCLVVVSHVPHFLHEANFAFNFLSLGRLGVVLFFVHTTLVLFMSLERHGAAMGPFLMRRIFRIYPLAIWAVLLMAVALWAGGRPLGTWQVVSNLLLVQNLSGHDSVPDPLWTLPYEVQMYLVLPALYVFTSARPMRIGVLYLAALAIAAVFWLAQWHPIYTLHVLFLPYFLPGAIAFLLLQRVRPTLSPWVLFAAVAAGVCLVAWWPSMTPRTEVPVFWAVSIVVGLTIPFCREITSRPLMVCSQQIARHSYGIYITHVMAMGLILTAEAGSWYVRLFLYAVAQALLAAMVYRGIEAPGIRLGAKLASGDGLHADVEACGSKVRPSPCDPGVRVREPRALQASKNG